MTDYFDRLQAIKENLERLMAEQSKTDQKLANEIAAMEKEVALASALAALKAAATDCRHERTRVQVNGARELIQKVLAA